MNTIPKDQKYTRTQVIPGKTYTCGCDYRGPYTISTPFPMGSVVDKKLCPTHGQPVA